MVPGFYAAEWFVWNWWRLRWEPRSASDTWAFAHNMTSIGEGYIWPNITIFSDGVRTALISSPSMRPDAKPFRYVGSVPCVVPSGLFEAAIDEFVQQVLSQLEANGLRTTNLHKLWSDVRTERQIPQLAERRKLEALLGRDPDEIEEGKLDKLIEQYSHLGRAALEEVAADRTASGHRAKDLPPAEKFESVAEERGYALSVRDGVRLKREFQISRDVHKPAWRIGAAAAQSVRQQESLGAAPLSNHRLAQLAGSEERALSDVGVSGFDIAFVLDKAQSASRVVLRSKWQTGRRFDLARLLGDRLVSPSGALHPATRAHTYRQKAQRAFAAELLSPFEVVDEMLAGDFSSENQEEVATHFDVSPMTIHTLLMNHGRIPREETDIDFDAAA